MAHRRIALVVLLPALLAFKGAGSWSPAGDTGAERYHQAASQLKDGQVLVTGGEGPISASASAAALLFHQPSTWTAAASMANPRWSHTQTTLADGRVLVAGGIVGVGDWDTGITFSYLSSAEIYSPKTDTWSPAASMNQNRGRHTATLLLDGRVLVAGGWSPTTLASAEVYDPALNTWTTVGSLGTARGNHVAVGLNDGRVLIAGGDGLSSAELFDPVSDSFSATGSFLGGPTEPRAVLMDDGRVMLGEGIPQIYSPATGTWSSTSAPALYYRSGSALAVLKDGHVLMIGGQANGAAIDDVQIYDPAADAWTTDAPLLGVRYLHHAATLRNGKVLVFGGFKGSGLQSSAEVYSR